MQGEKTDVIKDDKDHMIYKVLEKTYIDLTCLSEKEIEDFNIVDKLEYLNIEVKPWREMALVDDKFDKSRLHSLSSKKYDFYCIISKALFYGVVGEGEKYKTVESLKKEYNKVGFELIDKLTLYKQDKLTIKDIAEYIKTMK